MGGSIGWRGVSFDRLRMNDKAGVFDRLRMSFDKLRMNDLAGLRFVKALGRGCRRVWGYGVGGFWRA